MDNPQNPDNQLQDTTPNLQNSLKELDQELENLKIDHDDSSPNDINPQDQVQENQEEVDFLNDCLQGANEKLNLTHDEKEDLEDLDDEQIQKEYENFMRNIANSTKANDFLGQLNKLMEAGLNSNMNVDTDFGNLLGGLEEGNDFDVFTDNLIGQFIDKEVIYEPLKEAKQKVEEHINTATVNKTPRNIKVLQILNEIIELMDKDAQNTNEGKERIMQLFEELQDQGGLPEEIVKNSMADNPEMAKLQELTQGKGCIIF